MFIESVKTQYVWPVLAAHNVILNLETLTNPKTDCKSKWINPQQIRTFYNQGTKLDSHPSEGFYFGSSTRRQLPNDTTCK